MKFSHKAWWIAVTALLAPSVYLGYWISQLARTQAERMDRIAFSIAEDSEAWEGITIGGEQPLAVYYSMRETNEYMLVAGGLMAVLLGIGLVLVVIGWLAASRSAAPTGEAPD